MVWRNVRGETLDRALGDTAGAVGPDAPIMVDGVRVEAGDYVVAEPPLYPPCPAG